jgi:transcriptional regulator with XRE-family HTH domain
MKEIDIIEKKLLSGGFRFFTSEVIQSIKKRHNIYQYEIAERFKVPAIVISNIKSYRDKKNDSLLWNIIQEYNVDYNSIIEKINKNITTSRENEAKRIKENQFKQFAYLYDEIKDVVVVNILNINTYRGESTLENIESGEIYQGRLYRRNINFSNQINLKKLPYNPTELQIMLNGKNINKLVKEKEIISGIATEIDKMDDGFGIKIVLITPSDLDEEFENYIKYFFKNKELQAGFKASSTADFKEMILNYQKHNKEITIKLPKELITGYNQFLEYFSDYVRYAKGEEILFNVNKLDDGLTIDLSVSENSNIDIIGKYLEEYLNIAKQNIDNLKINIETDLSESDFNILVLDLKHQVTGLKQSLEIANLRNNLISSQVDHLKELSTSFAKKDNIIHTQIIYGGSQQFADNIKNPI